MVQGYEGMFLLMLLFLLANHCTSSHMLYALHLFLSCRWRLLEALGEEEERVSMILEEVCSCLCCYSCSIIAPCQLILITHCTYFFAGLMDGDTFLRDNQFVWYSTITREGGQEEQASKADWHRLVWYAIILAGREESLWAIISNQRCNCYLIIPGGVWAIGDKGGEV